MDIVLVCIGTDKCVGDSLGPLVGTDLEKWIKRTKKQNVYIYGTLNNCVTALNLKQVLSDINLRHKNAFIIAIDACVHSNVGEIKIKKGAINPGSGVGKELDKVGDLSILGCVTNNSSILFANGIKLSLILEIKERIVKKTKFIVNKQIKKQQF